MGALAAVLSGAKVAIVLVTDGSESLVPENVLRENGWEPEMSPPAQRALRGRIRVQEAIEEARGLGYEPGTVRVMTRQRWFTDHRTPPDCLHPDLSLRDVAGFVPGAVDTDARDEFYGLLTGASLCAAPDSNDRLLMHRVVTQLVAETRGATPLLAYECLSTIEPTGPQILFGFGEELMTVKRRAISAHRSMTERRRQFGGYSNPGKDSYEEIVCRRNAALAREHSLEMPFAERYGWLP
jgi:hypothetical protein